jgi:hypothetical protein
MRDSLQFVFLVFVLTMLLFMTTNVFGAENELLWDEPADVTGIATYQIDRATLPGNAQCANATEDSYSFVAEVPVGTQGWRDTSVVEGNVYCYKAYSANPDQGRSPPSNVAGRYVPFSTAPLNAPANLRITTPAN